MSRRFGGEIIGPLSTEEVKPYVISVIHVYWARLAEYYQWAKKMDRDSYYVIEHPDVVLGLVSCTYYKTQNRSTIYVTQPNDQPKGWVLYNGSMQEKDWGGNPQWDFLEDLKRVYGALAPNANVSSVPVFPPSAHDMAEATRTIELIRRWRLQAV